MKNILLLTTALIFSFTLQAQQKGKFPIGENKLITYEEVVHHQGVGKALLFARAKKWFNSYYKNPTSIIKKADAENGEIKGIHKIRIYGFRKDGSEFRAGTVGYTIFVYVKEGRYKYQLTKFNITDSHYRPLEDWLGSTNPKEKERLEQVYEFVTALIKDLEVHMSGRAKEKNDDW